MPSCVKFDTSRRYLSSAVQQLSRLHVGTISSRLQGRINLLCFVVQLSGHIQFDSDTYQRLGITGCRSLRRK
ncbi:uncharacterized protein PHALS_07504 [Plasmopara halstedii]|uniref:Uncharacterized protein n=1 Tax=Plasmopara halstedii TaxID=4781 RepID=A0A0P1B6B0_PLAHL|nr:uncharacterized protein PHALS_07504 [Plasmopara halstedii]CEG49758.1 hypothetical protein PHALS_07504 [Plasmopara halstedii]|eukprot:XP_024586127.1 hypothetical protein PHALS_07504 [Plasmopara halstedii]